MEPEGLNMDAPADKKGGEPTDIVAEATSSGKLDGLQSTLEEFGWDIPAGELMLLAQKDDRTAGKSPDELSTMLRDDTSLYDDLEAYKPGGKLDRPAKEEPVAEEEPSEDASKEMSDYMEQSSAKGGDAKKGIGAMKKAGAKQPSDLDKSYDKKKSFLTDMAGE